MRKKIALIALFIFLVFFGKIAFDALRFSPVLLDLLFRKDITLKKTNGNINVLLLGIGGGSHDGPNLTDTIILANLDTINNKVTLASIPRDLWVPDLAGNVKKINSAYAYGESVRKGGGLPLAKAAIAKITGQNIDYGIRIDFSGFVKAVDITGGLDINVDRSFDDFQYPIEGKETDTCGITIDKLQAMASESAEQQAAEFICRYESIHFNKGLNHMNGETALKFVRSRHAKGVEGTDFARSQRQEKVIKAFKDKVLSAQTLINPAKTIGLYNILQGSIDTDIKQNEFDDFIRLAQKMKNATIQSFVIDIGDEQTQRSGLLVNPSSSSEYNYAWVLIPRVGNGNFSEIQKYLACFINNSSCASSKKINY